MPASAGRVAAQRSTIPDDIAPLVVSASRSYRGGSDIVQGSLSGLLIIPILAVLILVHEFGHFFAARAVGVKVEEFGIGIPPRIKGWTRNGVIWSLNAIPFGGFVRVLGEDGSSHDPGSMNNKTPAQRAFFLAAGSLMNILLAIGLMTAIVAFQGETSDRTYILSVQPGSPAEAAGWQAGDRIIEVAGVPVESNETIRAQTRAFVDRPMSVIVERGNERVETTVTPDSRRTAEQGLTGIGLTDAPAATVTISTVSPDSAAAAAGLAAGDRIVSVDGVPSVDSVALLGALERASGGEATVVVERAGSEVPLAVAVPAGSETQFDPAALGLDLRTDVIYSAIPPAQIIPRGLSETWGVITSLLGGLAQLFTGGVSIGELAGPIGMGQLTSEIVSQSTAPLWYTVANLTIFLSLNLAVLNLLPFPALDGGRLLFILIEVIRGGRRISPERESLVNFFGLAILIGLMFVIAFLDVGRIINGNSLVP